MRLGIGAILFPALVAVLSVSAQAQTPPPQVIPGELVVKFKPGYENIRALVHAAQKSRVALSIPKINFELVKLAPGVSVEQGIARYKTYPYVTVAEPNYKHQRRLTPNDPLFGQQYGAIRMKLPQAWDVSTGDLGVAVCVIDDGVDRAHPDLAPNYIGGRDFIGNDDDPTPENGDSHGTHVAGIAAAASNNGIGVAGMGFNVSLMGVRINFSTAQSAAAMIWATDNGADVVNMSYGYYGPPTMVESSAVDYAWANNVILVAAAGNIQYSGMDSYPDGYPKVICVGSTGPNDAKSGFSDFGPRVDVAGPGENIMSTLPNNTYGGNTGTSMSSPGVAGVVALLIAHGGGSLTNQDIRDALEETTVDVGDWLVHGLVNAEAAIELIRPLIDVDVNAGSVEVMQGTHSGGDMNSLLYSDNNHFRVLTSNVPRVGAVGSAVVEFELPFNINLLRDSTLVIEVAGVKLATNFLYLWNWNTSNWVSVKQFPLSSADTTYRHEMGTTIKNYVQGGKFRILTRGQMNLRRGGAVTPFTYKIDRAQLETRIQQ